MPYINIEDKDEVEKYKKYLYNSEYSSVNQDILDITSTNKKGYIVYVEKNGIIEASIKIEIENIILNQKVAISRDGPVCDIYDIKLVKRLVKQVNLMLKQEKIKIASIIMKPVVIYDDKLKLLYEKEKYKVYQNSASQIIDDIDNFVYSEQVISGIDKGKRRKYILKNFQCLHEFILPNELRHYVTDEEYEKIQRYWNDIKDYAKLGFSYVISKKHGIAYAMYAMYNSKIEVICDRCEDMSSAFMIYDSIVEIAQKCKYTTVYLSNIFDTKETLRLKLNFSKDTRKYIGAIVKVNNLLSFSVIKMLKGGLKNE